MSSVTDPSNGNSAKVDDNRRLGVNAKSSPLQHIVSEEEQQAYQASGTVTLVNGAGVAIHLLNTSTSKNVIVTFVRAQLVDPTAAVPEAATYVTINKGQTVASGGTPVTPTNMYIGHSNAADVTATSGVSAITAGGTAVEFDRWYPKEDGDLVRWNKEAVLIIPPQQAIDISITSGPAGGTMYARISFIMEAPGE